MAVKWHSGKIDFRKLTSAPVTSEVVGSIPGQTHSWCDLSDSIGFLRVGGSSFLLHTLQKNNIVCRANNVLVDTQLSILYLKVRALKYLGLYSENSCTWESCLFAFYQPQISRNLSSSPNSWICNTHVLRRLTVYQKAYSWY
jgi:hypothetical protein